MKGTYGAWFYGINEREIGGRRRYNEPFPEDISRSDRLPDFVYEGRIRIGTKKERREFYRGPLVVAGAPVLVVGGGVVGRAAVKYGREYVDEVLAGLPDDLKRAILGRIMESAAEALDPSGDLGSKRPPDEVVREHGDAENYQRSRPGVRFRK